MDRRSVKTSRRECVSAGAILAYCDPKSAGSGNFIVCQLVPTPDATAAFNASQRKAEADQDDRRVLSGSIFNRRHEVGVAAILMRANDEVTRRS